MSLGCVGQVARGEGVGVLLLLNSDCPVTSVSYLHVSIVAAFDGSFAERVQACEVTEQAQSFLAFLLSLDMFCVCMYVSSLSFFFFSFLNVVRFCLPIRETVSVYSFVQSIPVLLIVKNLCFISL